MRLGSINIALQIDYLLQSSNQIFFYTPFPLYTNMKYSNAEWICDKRYPPKLRSSISGLLSSSLEISVSFPTLCWPKISTLPCKTSPRWPNLTDGETSGKSSVSAGCISSKLVGQRFLHSIFTAVILAVGFFNCVSELGVWDRARFDEDNNDEDDVNISLSRLVFLYILFKISSMSEWRFERMFKYL